MAVTRRYHSWPPGEAAYVGMDFSDLLPPGTALATGQVTIVINSNPTQPQTDFTISPVQLQNRQAWAQLQGGNAGTDYQVRWTVGDSRQNVWNRTALLLCAESS